MLAVSYNTACHHAAVASPLQTEGDGFDSQDNTSYRNVLLWLVHLSSKRLILILKMPFIVDVDTGKQHKRVFNL